MNEIVTGSFASLCKWFEQKLSLVGRAENSKEGMVLYFLLGSDGVWKDRRWYGTISCFLTIDHLFCAVQN